MKTIIAALCAVSAAAATFPTFPLDWSAIVTDSILLNQGGMVNPDGSVCCEARSPECKVQTAYQAARQFFAYTQNLTAMKAPDNSGVVTNFNTLKEYQVDSEGNCQAYCPLPHSESEIFPFGIDPNSTMVGTVPCGDETCQHWQFVTKIPILNITMEEDDFFIYTDASGKNAPSYITQHIEPLGEQIGDENQTFAQWQDMDGKTFPAGAFTVKGAAACPMAQNCQGDDDGAKSNDNMPMLEGTPSDLFFTYGMPVAGTTHRSVLFIEQYARYVAKQAGERITEEMEQLLAGLSFREQSVARRVLSRSD